MARPADDLCDQPLQVVAHEGAVVLLGPDGMALAMTVRAAELSAKLLSEAAAEARRTER